MMITANVYSTEALQPEVARAINHGLDLVGEHTGPITVNKVLEVNLVNDGGIVRAKNVGYDNLDPYTDLHIFVAAYSGKSRGVSYVGTGVSWLNLVEDTGVYGHSTVAHEVAHSLGFVSPGAPQSLGRTGAHCVDLECIMAPSMERVQSVRRGIGIGAFRPFTRRVDTSGYNQQAFCGDCVVDMGTNTEANLRALRHRRVQSGRIISPVDLRRS